jgi:hypothetical protein
MSTISISARTEARPYRALLQPVRDIIAGSRDGLAMQDRYEALARLSASELARRGITRADFPCLAVNGERRPVNQID